MVFDMTDPYCTLVLRGIENTLYQSSFLPILTDVHNERSRFERYLEMLLDRRIEGLVVLANWLFVDINVLADLEKNNIPTATVGRELKNDKISSVIVDNTAAPLLRSTTPSPPITRASTSSSSPPARSCGTSGPRCPRSARTVN